MKGIGLIKETNIIFGCRGTDFNKKKIIIESYYQLLLKFRAFL